MEERTIELVETVAPFKEIIDAIKASGGDAFKRCFQCGLCDTVCPWNRVINFSMRKLVREATFGLTDIETEDIWRCTTCGRCPQQCPRDVKQIDSGVAIRRVATQYEVYAKGANPIRGIKSNLNAQGNPFGEDRGKRTEWTEGLDVKPFAEGMEVLYFPCCYLSYDPRLKKVARATASVLNSAGVDYGILGAEQNCCGESVRKTGDEELFKKLAKDNIKAFIDRGVNKILVSSPHCYHTLKNEYSQFRVNFEVVHISQYLAELVREGRLQFTKDIEEKLTYHDPCYLGRHNGIYDEPRQVLNRVSDGNLSELPEARADSLCCGGGGGRVWMETLKAERFSDLRMGQALEMGAEVLATSCPYCITMFEDSRKTMDVTEKIQVKDITEIISELI